MRKASFRILVGLIVALVYTKSALAQDAPKDHFESENQSTKVREPVLAKISSLKSFKKIPYKIPKADLKELQPTPISANDFSQLNQKRLHDGAVVGKVESVQLVQDGKKLLLNFGKDPRLCFKAVIDESDYEKFGHKNPQRIGTVYYNKTVLVSGLITQHQNMPQIVVTLPYQLEVVSGN